jgi:hypothetical protein
MEAEEVLLMVKVFGGKNWKYVHGVNDYLKKLWTGSGMKDHDEWV